MVDYREMGFVPINQMRSLYDVVRPLNSRDICVSAGAGHACSGEIGTGCCAVSRLMAGDSSRVGYVVASRSLGVYPTGHGVAAGPLLDQHLIG
jgi:hypothetical protein